MPLMKIHKLIVKNALLLVNLFRGDGISDEWKNGMMDIVEGGLFIFQLLQTSFNSEQKHENACKNNG